MPGLCTWYERSSPAVCARCIVLQQKPAAETAELPCYQACTSCCIRTSSIQTMHVVPLQCVQHPQYVPAPLQRTVVRAAVMKRCFSADGLSHVGSTGTGAATAAAMHRCLAGRSHSCCCCRRCPLHCCCCSSCCWRGHNAQVLWGAPRPQASWCADWAAQQRPDACLSTPNGSCVEHTGTGHAL